MVPTAPACAAAQVEAYLEAFAKEYGLRRHIQYATRVVEVLPLGPEGAAQNGAAHGHVNGSGPEPGGVPWPRWQVTTERVGKQVTPQPPWKASPLMAPQSSAAPPPQQPAHASILCEPYNLALWVRQTLI